MVWVGVFCGDVVRLVAGAGVGVWIDEVELSIGRLY